MTGGRRPMLFNTKKRDYKPTPSQNKSGNASGSSGYKKEIGGVFLATLVIFLSLACISYNPQDNTLFHYASNRHVTANWAGAVGANIAAFLFYLLGSAAYIFLACLFLLAYRMFIRKTASLFSTVPLLLVLATTATLGTILQPTLSFISGGLLGTSLNHWLTIVIGAQGTVIVLLATLWISSLVIFQIPLFPFFRTMGLLFKTCVLWVMRPLGLVITTGMRALWEKIWSKKQTVPTATTPITSEILTGAVKSNDHEIDTDYWDDVLQTNNQINDRVNDITDTQNNLASLDDNLVPETSEKLLKFAGQELFQTSRHIKVFKTPYALLPNTPISQNIFAPSEPNGLSIAQEIHKIITPAKNSTKTITSTYKLPDAQLFTQPKENNDIHVITDESTKRGKLLEEKLLHFGVKGVVTAIKPGPLITLFEYKPEIDSKISKITALEDDLAMALTANSIRIIAPIPGKNAVGFEIANQTRSDVSFTAILQSKEFTDFKGRLPLILGVDVSGKAIVEDLATTPHLLVGGATGSGKSVGLNVMLVSLLCALNSHKLKLILIDPKRLEFTPYADIPHLLFPIVTQAPRAISVLKWVVQEMESRYEAMSRAGVRNIGEYHRYTNSWKPSANNKQQEKPRDIPYLVVIIDELADLMIVAGKEVEIHIVRIAQMARAAGIHMIVATQRPSVDVVTGLIKVNFPSRVAFRVSSKVDSRTILDAQGAEKLLGRGDMLYMHSASPDLKRVHGAYVSDQEIENLANFLRAQAKPEYLDLNELLHHDEAQKPQELHDELYEDILNFVKTSEEISISMIQRQYRIGFNRSARIIEKLELDGIIAPAQGSKPRKVLR